MNKKREQHENSLKNLKKFSKDYQPSPENKSKGQLKASAERKAIEKSADIINRLLQKTIKNKNTGEELTQKEAMLYGVIAKAIKENDLKAVELVLKIIGDFDNKLVLSGDVGVQKIFVTQKEVKEVNKHIDDIIGG